MYIVFQNTFSEEHYFGKNTVKDHFHILGMGLELAWDVG